MTREIIVHCSDSDYGNAALITVWHLQRQFRNIGYNFVILNGKISSSCELKWFNGIIETGRALDEDGAHCFTSDHEILTIDGWKFINEITENDYIAELDNDFNTYFRNPLKIIESKTNKLIKCNSRNISFVCTEGHEFLNKCPKGIYKKEKIKDFYKINNRVIPCSGNYEGSIEIDEDLLRLFIAIICDGNLIKDKDYIKGFRFSLKKERKIKELQRLLKVNGFDINYKIRYDGAYIFRLYSVDFIKKFLEWCPNKELGNNFISLKKNIRDKVVDFYAFWDGHNSGKAGMTISTISKQNNDILQAIAALSGKYRLTSNYKLKKNGYIEDRMLYDLVQNNKSYTQLRPENFTAINVKNEPVFCVETKAGNIIVRHNGKYIVSGNCLNHNDAIGICLIGKSNKFTSQQIESLHNLIKTLKVKYDIGAVKQHSDYESMKPFCAGLSPETMGLLNK